MLHRHFPLFKVEKNTFISNLFRFVKLLNVINVHKGILRKVQNLSVQVHLEQTMRILK